MYQITTASGSLLYDFSDNLMTADHDNLRTLNVEAVILRVQGHPQLYGTLEANLKHLNLGLNLTSTKK